MVIGLVCTLLSELSFIIYYTPFNVPILHVFLFVYVCVCMTVENNCTFEVLFSMIYRYSHCYM